jgi:hypothetical protein
VIASDSLDSAVIFRVVAAGADGEVLLVIGEVPAVREFLRRDR